MAQQLRTLAALARLLKFGFERPCQAAHNCKYFQLQGNLMPSVGLSGTLWNFEGTALRCMYIYTDTHIPRTKSKYLEFLNLSLIFVGHGGACLQSQHSVRQREVDL